MQARLPGLTHGRAHDFRGEAGDLDVHLHGGHAVSRAGDLEVHIAESVFIAQNIGQNDEIGILFDQAHGDAGHRGADGYAGIHERKAAAADRGHARGAVGFQGFGYNANGKGKAVVLGQNRPQGLFGKRAMADFPARDANRLDFANRERREVIVEHEFLGYIAG